MTCIKTGFHAYLEPYDAWLYGDAFEFNGVYLFRICEVSYSPLRDVKHFTIETWDNWFDERNTSQERNSTMITRGVTAHGYEGVPLK